MAALIPEINSCLPRMTGGEKRFAHRLRDKLEDDYVCWYDVPVGDKKLHPDFIVLHPRRGILILEIKDWKLENIKHVTPASVDLMTPKGVVKQRSPIEQARQYAHSVVDVLKKDKALIAPPGTQYEGKLLFPWGYGAVFTNINRKAFQDAGLENIFAPDSIICKDEMIESTDPEVFQKRLWGMFVHTFGNILSIPQIDRIRWLMFPEIRIEQPAIKDQLSLFEPRVEAEMPDLMKVMDLQQEKLARSLGSGHRVIHGVSGSGKTLILCCRCAYLAEQSEKPVLVICFNVPLSVKLHQMIADKGMSGKIIIRHFHAWCSDMLRFYHVPKPPYSNNFFDDLVRVVTQATEQGQIPSGQYGAVLIDEGHDFRPEWLRLAARMVDPETDSLLLLYDSAQNIYGKGSRLGFSLSDAGIKARGRTTILRVNYRSTAAILSLAYEFAKDIFAEKGSKNSVPVVKPESAGRKGAAPEIARLSSLNQEIFWLADRLRKANKDGLPWNDMAVLYRQQFIGEKVANALKKNGIPVEWLQESKQGRYYRPDDNSVKITTMHSSKGLEFPLVAIPGLGYMPHSYGDPQDEAKLLYVAMTRAMDNLILTSHRDSDFAIRIGNAYRHAV